MRGSLAPPAAMSAMLVVALLALGGAVPPAAASGRDANDSLTVAARAVPLPVGTWRMVAERRETFRLRSGGGYPVSRRTLIQERGGQLVGIVGVVASEPFARPVRALTAPETCSPRLFYRAIRLALGAENHDCVVLAPFRPGLDRLETDAPQAKVVWPAVAAAARERGLALPAIFTCAYHSLFDSSGWLEVSYCWNAEAFGLPRDNRDWEQNGLNPYNLGGPRQAFIDRAVAWMEQAHASVQRGFRGESVGTLPPF